MKNETGIGILDIHSDELLEGAVSSISEEYKSNVFIVSNKTFSKENQKNYTKQVSLATMRNYLISQMRIKNLKYYFILNSNVRIKDNNFFEKTINLAETFGTWFITGAGSNSIPVEDDTANLTLNLSPQLNTNFIFLYSGIIKNFGYFDERYYNTKDLDIVDYINKMREKEVYPPKHYNPTIEKDSLEEYVANIEKINFKEMPQSKEQYKPDDDKSLELSCAYFYHKHKYIPSQNDPSGVTQQVLLEFMEKLQKTYGSSK
jgi:hypothetical protein